MYPKIHHCLPYFPALIERSVIYKFTNTNTTPLFNKKNNNWRIFEQSIGQSTGTLVVDINLLRQRQNGHNLADEISN